MAIGGNLGVEVGEKRETCESKDSVACVCLCGRNRRVRAKPRARQKVCEREAFLGCSLAFLVGWLEASHTEVSGARNEHIRAERPREKNRQRDAHSHSPFYLSLPPANQHMCTGATNLDNQVSASSASGNRPKKRVAGACLLTDANIAVGGQKSKADFFFLSPADNLQIGTEGVVRTVHEDW